MMIIWWDFPFRLSNADYLPCPENKAKADGGRERDGLKMIEKSDKSNWYSSCILGRGQNRTGDRWDKSGAQTISFHKPDPVFIGSFSHRASDSCTNVVDDKSWWHINSIMVVFLEHCSANRSLIESITHTCANTPGLAGQRCSESGNDSPTRLSSTGAQFNYRFPIKCTSK